MMNQTNERTLALTLKETEFETERFRSLCECTEVHVQGRASAEAKLIYTLRAYTPNGEEIPVYEKPIAIGEDQTVFFVHEFDPVSLAVYQNAAEFSARVRDVGTGSLSLSVSIVENERSPPPCKP